MAVPKHIILFAEKSMEQAGLLTFAKNLGLAGTKFLSAHRSDGVKFNFKIPENLCQRSICSSCGQPPLMAVSSALAVFDELSSYAFVVKDKTCRFGVSVYLSTEILQAVPPGTDVIIIAKASKVGSTLGFATMEMYDTGGQLLARGDHIKHLPMGPMWDLMAKFVLSPLILPIFLKYGNTINSFKNMFLSDAKMVKMMVGADFKNPGGVIPEEIPLGDGIGDVFRYLNVQRIGTRADHSVSSEEEEKEAAVTEIAVGNPDMKFDRTVISGHDDEQLNRDGAVHESSRKQQNGDIGVYGFTVRPLLTNFLGLLHGGALAMGIEQAARMHAYGQTQLDVNTLNSSHHLNQTVTHSAHSVFNAPSQNTSSGIRHLEETDGLSRIVKQSATQDVTSDIDCEPIIPTIVRMEIIYKASMNNNLEITCTDSTCAEHSSEEFVASFDTRGKERGKSLRKISGEVFNTRASPGQPVLGSSATYTCFWSNN